MYFLDVIHAQILCPWIPPQLPLILIFLFIKTDPVVPLIENDTLLFSD